jgi:GGDEF domain-containing protein
VSTSIGIAWHAAGAPPVTGPELMARADAALYAAKRAQ